MISTYLLLKILKKMVECTNGDKKGNNSERKKQVLDKLTDLSYDSSNLAATNLVMWSILPNKLSSAHRENSVLSWRFIAKED